MYFVGFKPTDVQAGYGSFIEVPGEASGSPGEARRWLDSQGHGDYRLYFAMSSDAVENRMDAAVQAFHANCHY